LLLRACAYRSFEVHILVKARRASGNTSGRNFQNPFIVVDAALTAQVQGLCGSAAWQRQFAGQLDSNANVVLVTNGRLFGDLNGVFRPGAGNARQADDKRRESGSIFRHASCLRTILPAGDTAMSRKRWPRRRFGYSRIGL
jgi:hypothetical protein